MKRFLLISLSLLVLGIVHTGCGDNSAANKAMNEFMVWNDSLYNKYDYKKFKRYPPANKKINFNNINYQLMQAAIFYETNFRRIENNIKPFIYSYYLKKAAQIHATDMEQYNFFSHISPIPGRRKPRDRMKLAGFKSKYSVAAENIAKAYGKQYIIAGTEVKTLPIHTYHLLMI